MRRLLAGALTAVLVATACSPSTPDEDGTAAPTPAGTCLPGSERRVIVASDERPGDLHPYRADARITEWINQGFFEGLWGVDDNHEFFPELLAEEPTFETHTDRSVTVSMRLRDGLVWSDGTTLTSEHVEGTWRLIMEVQEGADGDFVLDFGPRTGHELIHPDSWSHGSDGTSFSFLLTEPFGGIRNLFKYVLPTHVLDSASAANLALASGRAGIEVLPASGPLRLERFSETDPVLLARNDRYHGSVHPNTVNPGPACITGIEIRFPASPERRAELLLDGSVDAVIGMASRDLAELVVARPDVTVASVNSLAVEHWGFNLRNPHLADPIVRRAIATAVDKQAVIDAVYGPIHGDAAPEPIGNFFLMPSQVGYVDHQADIGLGKAGAARQLLRDAGYDEGPDGTWRHPERGSLELEVGTTPDAVRQAQFEVMRRQLEEAGIRVTIREEQDFLTGVVFSEASLACSSGENAAAESAPDDEVTAAADCGLWDIAQFTWTFGSPWPGGQVAQFTTGSPQNPYGLTDEDVDGLATSCVAEMDVSAAVDCFNRLDAQVIGAGGAQGLVMIPITQRSTFVAWREATLVSLPAFSDAPSGGPFARAADIIATGATPSPTPSQPEAPSPSPSPASRPTGPATG